MIWRIAPPAWLQRLWWRGEKQRRKLSAVAYAVGGTVALLLAQDTIALICLLGYVHEMNQMEIGRLRAEIRAKRQWNEGLE